MDKRAKQYSGIGWFFIAYLAWLFLDSTLIATVLTNSIAAGSHNNHLLVGPITEPSQMVTAEGILSVIRALWNVALNLSIAALALMLRADCRLRIVKGRTGQPSTGSAL
jgi:hypothetical protein